MAERSRKISRRKKVVSANDFFFNLIVIMVSLALIGIMIMTVVIVNKTFGSEILGDGSYNGEVPVLEIQLAGTTLSEVHENGKEIKYPGNTMTLDGIKYENVEFKGRGNYSWVADKKSYRIKFDNKVSLLGMEKAKKWALVANSIDDSLMRNDLGYFITQKLIGDYQVRGEFVELVIDDENLGVYYLVRTFEIDKRIIDLRNEMGVLAELDNVYCGAEEKRYVAKNGDCFTVKDIVVSDNQEEVMDDFISKYNTLLDAIKKHDYGMVRSVVDIESFAKYYIISEITSNPDAYVTSWFMYKNGVNDKIHAGLAWDFDAAFGNRKWSGWQQEFNSPTLDLNRLEYAYGKKATNEYCRYDKSKTLVETVDVSLTMCQLLNFSEFRELVGVIYREELYDKKKQILSYLNERAAQINISVKKDAKLWNKGDFDEEIEYLNSWLDVRFDWFKEKFKGKKN